MNAFASAGTVNRVIILYDKFDNFKGFVYVEFFEFDVVYNVILLDGIEICGWKIKVLVKWINVFGMKVGGRGGRGGRGRGRFGGCGLMMMMMMLYLLYGGCGWGCGCGCGGCGGRGCGRGDGDGGDGE